MSQLRMRHPDLSRIPAVALPEGFEIRQSSVADVGGVTEVLQSAFPEMVWTAEKTLSDPLDNPGVRATYVVVHEGQIVGTVSGCDRELDGVPCGYVHWVGVHQSAQGNRLGYWSNLFILHVFVGWGYSSAILDTDDFRLAAIKTYLNLGFEPVMVDAEHPGRWDAVRSKLKMF